MADEINEATANASRPHCTTRSAIKPNKTDPSAKAISVSSGKKLVIAIELYTLHFHGFFAKTSTRNYTGRDNTCQRTTKNDAPIALLCLKQCEYYDNNLCRHI